MRKAGKSVDLGQFQRSLTFEWAPAGHVPDDSFGNLRWQNTLEEVENRYLFQGREWDSNRQDYYFRNRIYVPEWGSFTGPDMNLANGIEGEPNGVGSYLFCDNDPLDVRDPLGLGFWSNVIKGDFDSEDATWGGVAGQVGVGLIPVVGQIADARDTAANLHKVVLNPKSGVAWVGLGGAVVGWIPLAGDTLKGGFKVGKKVAIEAGESALAQVEKKVAKEGVDAATHEAKSLSKAAKNSAKDLLPDEGVVGTYDDLISAGTKGDNITPHHIPSANHMAEHGVPKGKGIAINMEQPPVGGRHRQTFTYGTQADIDLTPRQALGQGVWDARRIYQNDGLYGPEIRTRLQDLIHQQRTVNPGLFDK